MYPVLPLEDGGNFYHRRVTHDYGEKSLKDYVAPPVSKHYDQKNTFVHNQVANKYKVNVDHFANIFNRKVFDEKKRALIQ